MSAADDAAARRATTSGTLAKAAIACLVLGWIVGAPTGAMFLHTLAAVFALPAVLMARGPARFLPGVVLGIALAMMIATYPAYREHMAAYAAKAQP